MERHFDQELGELKALLLRMAGLAEQMVQKGVTALVTSDLKLAEELAQDDRTLDSLELQVEENCLTLLALRQPIATDLRFLTAALSISTDLERVGDHAINLADSARELARTAHPPVHPGKLRELADAAASMLKRALDAFVAGDSRAAVQVCADDDVADRLEDAIFESMVERMSGEAAAAAAGVQWILAARNLERVADLATNIAEEVIFIEQARVIKHHHEEPA